MLSASAKIRSLKAGVEVPMLAQTLANPSKWWQLHLWQLQQLWLARQKN
jgi:hypothetical protein